MNEELTRKKPLIGINNSRRFGAFFMDAAITAMFSMLLFAIAGAPMFGYYDKASALTAVDASLSASVAATHLLSQSGSIAPSDSLEETMGKSWVSNISGDYYSEQDCLRYYTIEYKKGTEADYLSLMTRTEDSYAYSYLFETTSPLSMKASYKELVHAYATSSSKGAEQEGAYNAAYAAFKSTYEKCWTEFGLSDSYKPLYQEHVNLNNSIMHAAAWGSLVSYLISSLFLYIAVPFINKNGRTIAKRALRLSVISDHGKLTAWQVVSRAFIETLEFSFITIFAPFFFIQTNAIYLTFAGSGLWTFNMFTLCLSSLLLTILSGALALFTKERKSLHDYATLTSVVDSASVDQIMKSREDAKEEDAEEELNDSKNGEAHHE